MAGHDAFLSLPPLGSGVAVGDGLGDVWACGRGDASGLGEGLTIGEGFGVGEGLGEGETVGEGDGLVSARATAPKLV